MNKKETDEKELLQNEIKRLKGRIEGLEIVSEKYMDKRVDLIKENQKLKDYIIYFAKKVEQHSCICEDDIKEILEDIKQISKEAKK